MAKEDKNTAIYVAYDDTEPLDSALPERNLLRAILLTAMSDLKKSGEPSRRATEYFLNPDDEYVFSFISVCNHLDIDPHRILIVTGLLKPKSSALAQPSENRTDNSPDSPKAS
jgi:hypothetical protein